MDVESLGKREWIRVASLLKKATLRAPELSVVEMIRAVKNEDAGMLLLTDEVRNLVGALVMRIVKFPTGYTVLIVQACGTDKTRISADNWREIISGVERFAEGAGCDAVRVPGRKGWGRILSGYTEAGRIYEKVVRRDD